MKGYILTILACVFLLVVSGCHQNVDGDNVVKNGTLYSYENIEFYYPDEFSLVYEDTTDELSQITFQSEDEYYCLVINSISEGNKEDELIELFRLDLEEAGYSVVSNTKITLENGDSCYEIVVESEEMKFKNLIIYENNEEICLSYYTTKENYDENISSVNNYLYTFTVKEEGE